MEQFEKHVFPDEIPPNKERERKFRLDCEDPVVARILSDTEAKDIEQHYIALGESESRVRRINDSEYFFTIKSSHLVERDEFEIPITEEEYNLLKELSLYSVRKKRYSYFFENRKIEIDRYLGDLEGLYVAEVEFSSLSDESAFNIPSWFGEELSYKEGYKNKNLAVYGIPVDSQLINKEIKSIDYKLGMENIVKYIELYQKALGRPIVVGVAGGSASGKSTIVSSKIAGDLESQCVTINLDDYYKGVSLMTESGIRLGRKISFDEPFAIDLSLAAKHLSSLTKGGTIDKPEYDFSSGERSGYSQMSLGDNKIIILEGLFSLKDNFKGLVDIGLFVDVDIPHGMFIRRFLRDLERTSWNPNEIITYFSELLEMYNKHIAPTKNNADIIINNHYDPSEESDKNNVHEIQLKYPAGDITENYIRSKLKAEFIAKLNQTDYYYQPENVDFVSERESIRLRNSLGKYFVFEYKGPVRVENGKRIRPKVSIPVEDSTVNTILSLYPTKIKKIEKVRSLFRFECILIALDEVSIDNSKEKLRFIELQGSSRSDRIAVDISFENVVRLLGIDSNFDSRSYQDMVS